MVCIRDSSLKKYAPLRREELIHKDDIDEVLYVKEDGNQFLRVVITKNGIIDVEDCVVVSNIINPLLDEANLIDEQYILDVCSKEKGCE